MMKERLKNFLDEDGRLKAFPARRKMKLCALLYLAEGFEPGRIYTEREIGERLTQLHTFGDPATLRRELVDYRFLVRSADGRSYRLCETQPTPQELGV